VLANKHYFYYSLIRVENFVPIFVNCLIKKVKIILIMEAV